MHRARILGPTASKQEAGTDAMAAIPTTELSRLDPDTVIEAQITHDLNQNPALPKLVPNHGPIASESPRPLGCRNNGEANSDAGPHITDAPTRLA